MRSGPAKHEGANLLMLPETFLNGYGDATAARALSPTVEEARLALAPIDPKNDLDILTNYSERDGNKLFNAEILVSSGGELRLNCRKAHLWGEFERATYRAGEAAPVVQLSSHIRAGVLICFDLEVAGTSQDLVCRGVDLILVMSATSSPYMVVPRIVVPARSYENAAFAAFCNLVGERNGEHFTGLKRAHLGHWSAPVLRIGLQ